MVTIAHRIQSNIPNMACHSQPKYQYQMKNLIPAYVHACMCENQQTSTRLSLLRLPLPAPQRLSTFTGSSSITLLSGLADRRWLRLQVQRQQTTGTEPGIPSLNSTALHGTLLRTRRADRCP
jgi:hypothetical protein